MALNKTYSDLKYGFPKLSSGDFSLVYDENSINQSLRTLFRTIKGERVFNPYYGTDIPRLLFEPFDEVTAQRIADEVNDAIKTWESARVRITDIHIKLDYEDSTYTVECTYDIISTLDSGQLIEVLQKT